MTSSTLRKLLALPVILMILWIGLRYLLPIGLPFLLALLLALAAEPLVSFLQKRHLPRYAATGIGVTISLGVLMLTIMVLAALLLRELGALAGVLPDLEGTAQAGMDSLETWLLQLADRMPKSVRPLVSQGVTGLFSDGTALLDQLTARLLQLASGILSQIPDSALGTGTWLLACYMISAKLPALRSAVSARLPESWHSRYLPMLKGLKTSASGWFLAQCKLVGITFLVLAAGFLALQIPYGLLWAAGICLVDALPVLGTGTILVPWSLVCFLQGDTVRGIGLLAIYTAASLVRSVLEPRFVGKQLGLDPLVTLVAMYAGYRLWGIGGMILFPLLAVMAANVLRSEKQPPPFSP